MKFVAFLVNCLWAGAGTIIMGKKSTGFIQLILAFFLFLSVLFLGWIPLFGWLFIVAFIANWIWSEVSVLTHVEKADIVPPASGIGR